MKVKITSIVFLLFSIVSFSQTKEINKKIDYLVDNKFSSLDIIDSVLRKNRKDKPILELLVKKSKEKAYLEGEFYGSNGLGRYYRDHSIFNKSIIQ